MDAHRYVSCLTLAVFVLPIAGACGGGGGNRPGSDGGPLADAGMRDASSADGGDAAADGAKLPADSGTDGFHPAADAGGPASDGPSPSNDVGGDSRADGPGPSSDAGQDAAADSSSVSGDAGTDVPVHPPLPQVVSLGGPVIAAPKVQPIAYQSDTGLADMDAFLQELTRTTYWSETTSEYGVGALTVLPTIVLNSTAPATIKDKDLQQMLTDNVGNPSSTWGGADPSIIYLFLIPPGTIVSDSTGANGCVDFDGYHDEINVDIVSATRSTMLHAAYAVSCACPGFDGPKITDVQERTVDISHELVESATDPFVESTLAYGEEDDADYAWTLVTGGEVADMCEFNSDAYFIPPGSTYMIQRTWSNAAARLTENPCVPHTTSDPYFNSFPALPLTQIQLSGLLTTQAVTIPAGQAATIDVDLFSTAPTGGPWTLTVYDGDSALGLSPQLALSLDKSTGQNGDTVHLTIEPVVEDPDSHAEEFIIYSEYGQPGDADYQNNLSMGMVYQGYGADAECNGQAQQACIDCCQSAHTAAFQAFQADAQACVCGSSGSCATVCATEFCLNGSATAGDACSTCINQAQGAGSSCFMAAQTACTADSTCAPYLSCTNGCPPATAKMHSRGTVVRRHRSRLGRPAP